MARICILGLGYIGLPTALLLALNGHQVLGVDINKDVVEKINKGEVCVEEPHLKKMVKLMIGRGRLVINTKPEIADVFIIAVPTPNKKDKSCDLGYVISAIRSIMPYLKKETISQ